MKSSGFSAYHIFIKAKQRDTHSSTKGNDEFPVSGEGVLIELVQAPPDMRTP